MKEHDRSGIKCRCSLGLQTGMEIQQEQPARTGMVEGRMPVMERIPLIWLHGGKTKDGFRNMFMATLLLARQK